MLSYCTLKLAFRVKFVLTGTKRIFVKYVNVNYNIYHIRYEVWTILKPHKKTSILDIAFIWDIIYRQYIK